MDKSKAERRLAACMESGNEGMYVRVVDVSSRDQKQADTIGLGLL